MSSQRPDEQMISQSMPVPEYKMGWIIGKRGTYVNQLAQKSGATITISDSISREYGTVWKYVQISGNGRAVDRAKKLLHIRLERLEPREIPATSPTATNAGISDGGDQNKINININNHNESDHDDDDDVVNVGAK